jgi:hypothetical protein
LWTTLWCPRLDHQALAFQALNAQPFGRFDRKHRPMTLLVNVGMTDAMTV